MTFKMTIQGPETWPVDIFFLFFAIAFCYLVAAAATAAAAASSQPLTAVFSSFEQPSELSRAESDKHCSRVVVQTS